MAGGLGFGLMALSAIILSTAILGAEDLPCRARDVGIEGRSIVCVCDASYCDTITREDPAPGTFVVYTSSEAGQRFEKSYGEILIEPVPEPEPEPEPEGDGDEAEGDGDEAEGDGDEAEGDGDEAEGDGDEQPESDGDEQEPEGIDELPPDDEEGESEISLIPEGLFNSSRYRIFTNLRYQVIEGFGGSVTDAASINWRSLSTRAQTKLIEAYFGPQGLEYNLVRFPIGGSDFSTHPYTLNDEPWHDASLSNFSLSEEDYFYKLPMIKRALTIAQHEIKFVASTWSPPVWMKTNERITGFGQLKPEYFQTYADYHLRFLEEYEKAEVKVWAITTTNEPINGIVPWAPFNSLGITPKQMARYLVNNIGPTIRNSRFNDTKILAIDDQRYLLHLYLLGMYYEDPKAFEYMDGVAIHYYGNFFPAAILSDINSRFPNKIMLSTEACEGPMPWHINKVEIGSWRRARRYVTSILQDLNNYVVGWIDWNLCLDPNGGPNWADNFVDSPILVYKDQDEFIKNPMYYAMGHFSKFIPRGSIRILSDRRSLVSMENLAVLTPKGNIVMVLQNRRRRPITTRIDMPSRRYIEITMEPRSVKTIEINHNF